MIKWKNVDELSGGHGVLFIYLPINKAIAFLEGYEWLHGDPENVVVELLKNSSELFKEYNLDGISVTKKVKDTIMYFLNNKDMQDGKYMNQYFRVWFNA